MLRRQGREDPQDETHKLPRVSSVLFSSRRRHTRWNCDWSSDVCSSDLRICEFGRLAELLSKRHLEQKTAKWAPFRELIFPSTGYEFPEAPMRQHKEPGFWQDIFFCHPIS